MAFPNDPNARRSAVAVSPTLARQVATAKPKAAPLPVAPTVPSPAIAPATPTPEVVTAAPPVPTTTEPPNPTAAIPVPATTANGTVQATPTNPATALTTQTLSVAPTVDRFKIAEDRYNAGEPAYQATLREAQRRAFGAGRGVSGALRTSLGDAASAREGQRVGFLSDALQGTIDDAYKNVGIAQQQQGFQAGQQQTAFNQDFQTKQLQDAITNSAFGRALQQAQFGYGNDPSQIALILSQIFGNQASAAGDAASGLFRQQGTNAGSSGLGGLPRWALDILKQQTVPTGTRTTGAENLPNYDLG